MAFGIQESTSKLWDPALIRHTANSALSTTGISLGSHEVWVQGLGEHETTISQALTKPRQPIFLQYCKVATWWWQSPFATHLGT